MSCVAWGREGVMVCYFESLFTWTSTLSILSTPTVSETTPISRDLLLVDQVNDGGHCTRSRRPIGSDLVHTLFSPTHPAEV